MGCAVCNADMILMMRHGDDNITACERCDYEEHFIAGETYMVIRGAVIKCGDPRTIEGNLQSWNAWFAILQAREALRNG